MADKQIHELTALQSTLTTGNVFAVDTGENTYKIDYDTLATAIINKLGGDPVTLAHGGTGATSAAAALTALGAVAKAGDTMSGALSVNPGIYIVSDGNPTLHFKPITGTKDNATIYGLSGSNQILFRSWHTGDTNYDNFNMPAPSATGANGNYHILTTKQSITNVTIGNSTYIDTIDGGYIKLGLVVVFSVSFKTKIAISSSVTSAISGLPSALYISKFMVNSNSKDDTDMVRTANIDGGNITIKGSFASGSTYNISGAYISAS